jgi:hypothetical protein
MIVKEFLRNKVAIRLSVILVLALMMLSFSTQTNYHFVQFRVLAIPDSETARAIDEKIGSKSGIIESRADHVTSTYFCLLTADSGYTEDDFKAWFAKLGFEIACYSEGVQNIDVMISPHILKNCTEENEEMK